MANLNRVFIIGNLTKAPSLRYTPGGSAVADLRLAINSTFISKGGERRDEVCYVDVVTWGRQAETAAEFLTKGSPVFVEGRLQLDTWETQNGEKRSRIRIRAQRIQFLGRGKGADNRQGDGSFTEAAADTPPVENLARNEESSEAIEEDIPF
jgi:single-strand DNA-binding protein